MGARIAIGAGVALVIGVAVWAALPAGGAAENGRPSTNLSSAAGLPGPSANAAPAVNAAPADVRAKVDSCLAGQRQVAELRRTRGGPAPVDGPSDQSIVSRACAPLFAEAGCRDAQLSFDAPPRERRSAAVMEACTKGYCAQLPAPKPAACDHPPGSDQEVLPMWTELRAAILRHDIGEAEMARAYPPR